MKKILFLLLITFACQLIEAQNVITSQPQGEVSNLYRQSDSYYLVGDYVYRTHIDGELAEVVKASDGTYYLHNPFSTLHTDTWMKMEPDGNGGLRVPVMQPIVDDLTMYMEVDDDVKSPAKGLIASLKLNSEGNSYIVDKTADYLHFTLKDGIISLEEGETMGLIFESNMDWTGYCDYNTSYTDLSSSKVLLPNDINSLAEDYFISYNYGQKVRDAMPVKVYFGDDKVYISVFEGGSTLWLCGQIDDGKIIVPALQYLGYYTDNPYGHMFVMSASYETLDDDGILYNYYSKSDDDIVFDFDAEKRTLTTNHTFLVNRSMNNVNYIAQFCEPQVKPLRSVVERPENPQISYYQSYLPLDDWGMIEFQQAPLTESGEYLPLNDMYFNIFFDDEKAIFTPAEYIYLTEEMTDVPLFFEDVEYNDETLPDFIVNGKSQQVFFYRDGLQHVGVQTFYFSGEQRLASDIVYTDGANVSAIDNHEVSDLDNIAGKTQFYDLQGRRMQRPIHSGLYIERVEGKQKKCLMR